MNYDALMAYLAKERAEESEHLYALYAEPHPLADRPEPSPNPVVATFEVDLTLDPEIPF